MKTSSHKNIFLWIKGKKKGKEEGKVKKKISRKMLLRPKLSYNSLIFFQNKDPTNDIFMAYESLHYQKVQMWRVNILSGKEWKQNRKS
jgi:hypothetical protein